MKADRKRKHRDVMRRSRARLAYLKRWRGFSLEGICSAVGLRISPISSLDPVIWAGAPELYFEGATTMNRKYLRRHGRMKLWGLSRNA